MKKPRNLNDTPRGDWNYRQPESGMTFRERHPRAMEEAVFRHRLSLPDLKMEVTGNWQQFLWDDICKQDEHLDCVDTEDKGRWPNLTDVWAWAESMLHWREKGYAIVPQEEAERRAAICITCPHNKPVSGCFGCKGVGEIIDRIIDGQRTSVNEKLHQCSACNGCVLGPKVFLPREVIHAEAYADKLPSFCWLAESVAP